jgi:D-glycero-D-manno-heptose 1,7-bisphosphate phosphatase
MKTIFLDRDGVINRNRDNDYVKSWDEFEFLPNSRHAIKLLTDAGYQLIVITNQACINKGIISSQTLDEVHRKMTHELKKAGGHIAAIYHCPHRDDDGCDCRKPKPGMLIQAASEHGVELTDAYLIGDSTRDIEAGQQVGCHTVLVLTGHGGKTDGQTSHKNVKPEKTCEDLYAATLWILSRTTL